MSPQAKAKEAQGYVDKAVPRTCMNCLHFRFDTGWHDEAHRYPKETNLRCGLGGFAVKKMATCKEWGIKQ